MKKRILKYYISDETVHLPIGKVLLVGHEGSGFWYPTIWLEVEDNAPLVPYVILPTGVSFTEGEHIGSAICGQFVWHIYRNVTP